MRGKVLQGFSFILPVGITPAYAGKSRPDVVPYLIPQDHPRLCGEKHLTCDGVAGVYGSPPPMRGKVLAVGRWANGGRDHPRLCGEKYLPAGFLPQYSGSPPPMRGKEFSTAAAIQYTGITPAYAGKRLIPIEFGGIETDHPRLCGEKSACHDWQKAASGSPPPMRGKAHCLCLFLRTSGITPAYAGKSTGGGLDGTFYKDHPRLCGEKLFR